jgi:hypothetical protein
VQFPSQCVLLAQQTPLQGGSPLPQGAAQQPLDPQRRLQHCTSVVRLTPTALHLQWPPRRTAAQHSPLDVQAMLPAAQVQELPPPEHSPAQQNSQHVQLDGLMLWHPKEQNPPQVIVPFAQPRLLFLLRLQRPEAHWAFFVHRPPGGAGTWCPGRWHRRSRRNHRRCRS